MNHRVIVAALFVVVVSSLSAGVVAAATVRKPALQAPRAARAAAAKIAEAQAMLASDDVDAARLAALLDSAHALAPAMDAMIAAQWRRRLIRSFGIIPRDSSRAAAERAIRLDDRLVLDDTMGVAVHILRDAVVAVKVESAMRPASAYLRGGEWDSLATPVRSDMIGAAVDRLDPRGFPRALRCPAPLDTRANGSQHPVVILRAAIGRDGRVGVIEDFRGVEALRDAAAEVLRGWRFRPMQAFGHPIEVVADIPVVFMRPGAGQPASADAIEASGKPGANTSSDHVPAPGEYVYVEELPEAITRVPPVSTGAIRRSGVEGTVILRALVGSDGRVADVRIMKSIPELDEAAVAAVRQWVFKPARSKGQPVPVWVAIPVKFSLQ